MQCRFYGEEGEASRFLAALRTDFLLLPAPLREKLLRETKYEPLSLEKVLQCVRLNKFNEWEWIPGLFREIGVNSFREILWIFHRIQGASTMGIWNYAVPHFGMPVHRYLGFRVMDRDTPCMTELHHHGAADSTFFSVTLYEVPREFCLEWNGGELTCDELSLFGFKVESPTWATCVAFFRELRMVECMLTLPDFLIPDLSELVAGYLIPLHFYKATVENYSIV
jgi:hypothetical protein